MAKKTTAAFLPHEEMMERFRKEGRVHRETLSIKALTVDHRLQAREKPLDLDNVKALHAVVKDGLTLAPITVFRIDGKDYVGNGFHRVAVHKKEGLTGILADVVDATWQEAVEFSTCCNMANHALQPSKEDKKKAAFMLWSAGWLNRSAGEIARHVNTNTNTVIRWRAEWCERNNHVVPSMVVDAKGRNRTSTTCATTGVRAITPVVGRSAFVSRVGGKHVRVSAATKGEAETEITNIEKRRTASIAVLQNTVLVSRFLASRGLFLDFDSTMGAKGLSGGVCRGYAATFIRDDLRSLSSASIGAVLVAAVGRVVLVAEHHAGRRKVVLVFEPIEGHETIVSLARRLGIEFMTLEQFVEVVKADKGGPLPDEPEFNEETASDLRESMAGVGLVRGEHEW